MEKRFDFRKIDPYIPINIMGIWITFLCIFSQALREFIASSILSVIFITINYFALGLILIFVFNISAFSSVWDNKTLPGIIFSLLLGSFGGFIAVNTVNRNFSKATIINCIFNIHFWIFVWSIIVFFEKPADIILLSGLFVLTMITGIFIINVPLKPLLTVNITVAVISSLTCIPAAMFRFNDILASEGTSLLLTGLAILMILLPNIILFILFRKQKEASRFRSYITKSILLFLCYFHAVIISLMIICFFALTIVY